MPRPSLQVGYRLRHLNTGRYLSLKSTKLWQKGLRLYRAMTLTGAMTGGSREGANQEGHIFSSTIARRDPAARISLHNIHNVVVARRDDDVPILDESAIHVEVGGVATGVSGGRYLHIGGAGQLEKLRGRDDRPPGTAMSEGAPQPEDARSTATPDMGEMTGATSSQQGAMLGESGFNIALAIAKKASALALMIHRVNLSQVSDVMVGVAAVPQLRLSIDKLVEARPALESVGREFTTTSRALREVFDEYVAVVRKLINFIVCADSLEAPFEYGELEAIVSKLSRGGGGSKTSVAHARRQALMREQGIIIMLLEALEIVAECCDKQVALSSGAGRESGIKAAVAAPRAIGGQSGVGRPGGATTPLSFWQEIRAKLSLPSFWLIFISLHRSPANQLHAADKLTTMIAYVPHDVTATKCIRHMLSSNMDVQEEKVGTDDVAKFIAMIRDAPMDASYLQVRSNR